MLGEQPAIDERQLRQLLVQRGRPVGQSGVEHLGQFREARSKIRSVLGGSLFEVFPKQSDRKYAGAVCEQAKQQPYHQDL